MRLSLLTMEVQSAKYSPHIHTHANAQTNFQKPYFWIRGTSKHINQVKTQHYKFWPKTILLLPNSSRVKRIMHIPFSFNIGCIRNVSLAVQNASITYFVKRKISHEPN